MDDDTRGPYPLSFNGRDVEDIGSMWKFKITREQATNCALRDVKFLIFDDTELQENGLDSDDEEGMLQQAIKMSTGGDGPSYSHAPSVSTSQAGPPHQKKMTRKRAIRLGNANPGSTLMAQKTQAAVIGRPSVHFPR